MAENHFGKFFFVLTLAVLAVTTLLFFSYWKLAWLLVFLVLGVVSWNKVQALFIFFLGNIIVSLAWALKKGALSDSTLSLFLIALLSALGFVATGASFGSKKKKSAQKTSAAKDAKKSSKSATSTAAKKGKTKSAKRTKKTARVKGRKKRR